jgi:protein phosphatase
MVVEQLKQLYKFSFEQFSIIGTRPNNEDKVLVSNHNDWQLVLLADGMGGYNNGEAAAELAVEIITESFFRNPGDTLQGINRIFEQTNKAISEKLSGAGTTIGGIYISNGNANIFWTGDVRVYLVDSVNTKYVTKDHSLAQLMRESKTVVKPIEIDRLKNTVTRGLGGNSTGYLPEMVNFKLASNLKGLVCSDGVHNLFNDSEIFDLLSQSDDVYMINILKERIFKKGTDNASAVLFSCILDSTGNNHS